MGLFQETAPVFCDGEEGIERFERVMDAVAGGCRLLESGEVDYGRYCFRDRCIVRDDRGVGPRPGRRPRRRSERRPPPMPMGLLTRRLLRLSGLIRPISRRRRRTRLGSSAAASSEKEDGPDCRKVFGGGDARHLGRMIGRDGDFEVLQFRTGRKRRREGELYRTAARLSVEEIVNCESVPEVIRAHATKDKRGRRDISPPPPPQSREA